MAGDALALHHDLEPQGVLIAVGAQLAHAQEVAAFLALLPKLVARSAPEMADARLERQRQRLGVHPGKHQHLAGGGIGDDRRNQAIGVELGLEHEALLDLAGRPARGKERRMGSHGTVFRVRRGAAQKRGPCTICRKRSR